MTTETTLVKKNIKKLMDEVKQTKSPMLNIGIEVGRKNPKIDYYCHNCEKPISHSQYKKGMGLCKACIRA